MVVVSHGGFLHALTEDWTGFNASAGGSALNIAGKRTILANMARYWMAELRDQGVRVYRKIDAE